MTTRTLQDRRTALARDAILDALVAHLEAGDADGISMEDLNSAGAQTVAPIELPAGAGAVDLAEITRDLDALM